MLISAQKIKGNVDPNYERDARAMFFGDVISKIHNKLHTSMIYGITLSMLSAARAVSS